MSFLKDFNETHISLRAIIIGLALVSPFWYFDLYLFHKKFFFNSSFYIPIVAAFCLSVCWHGLNIISATASFFMIGNMPEKINFTITASAIVSIAWIGLLTYVGYTFKFEIKEFINVVFGVSLFRLIFWGLLNRNHKKNQTKKANDKAAMLFNNMSKNSKFKNQANNDNQ